MRLQETKKSEFFGLGVFEGIVSRKCTTSNFCVINTVRTVFVHINWMLTNLWIVFSVMEAAYERLVRYKHNIHLKEKKY